MKTIQNGVATWSVLWVLAACLMLSGCASESAEATTQPFDSPFTLKLKVVTHDKRYLDFEVTKEGLLSYGGGRDAVLDNPSPVRKLTNRELQRILDVCDKNRLDDAPSYFLTQATKVEYIYSLNRGGLIGASLRNLDDENPGFKELEELLIQLRDAEK